MIGARSWHYLRRAL